MAAALNFNNDFNGGETIGGGVVGGGATGAVMGGGVMRAVMRTGWVHLCNGTEAEGAGKEKGQHSLIGSLRCSHDGAYMGGRRIQATHTADHPTAAAAAAAAATTAAAGPAVASAVRNDLFTPTVLLL
jgi:hypothetical protein